MVFSGYVWILDLQMMWYIHRFHPGNFSSTPLHIWHPNDYHGMVKVLYIMQALGIYTA